MSQIFFCFFAIILCGFVAAQPETNSTISQYCSKSTSQQTKWEQYMCEVIKDNKIDFRCWPQRRYSNISPPKGIIVMFHGYTACPQAFDTMAQNLQDNGFTIYSVLTVGHGRVYNDCSSSGSDCVSSDPIEYLPSSRGAYVQFVDRINSIIREENTLLVNRSNTWYGVGAIGLSLGGALASLATARGNGLYNKQILFNPFFGVTVPSVDKTVTDCNKNSSTCIDSYVDYVVDKLSTLSGSSNSSINSTNTKTDNTTAELKRVLKLFLTTELKARYKTSEVSGGYAMLQQLLRLVLSDAAEIPSALSLDVTNYLPTPISWGSGCENDRKNHNRAGYCNFRLRNLLGAHSAGQYALYSSQQTYGVKTQLVAVERDGITRNSMSFQSIQQIYHNNNTVSACMHRITPNCDLTGNECGVPHSMIALPDNEGSAPYYMYWEPIMLRQTLLYFTNAINDYGVTVWNNNRSLCVNQDYLNPDPNLVGPVPQVLQLLLDGAVNQFTQAIKNQISISVANLTGLEGPWINPVVNILTDQLLVTMENTVTGSTSLQSKVAQGQITKLEGFPVTYIQWNGNSIVYAPVQQTTSVSSATSIYVFKCLMLIAFLFTVL